MDAMANIKPGSGCNLLGYYMYRGGTTPTGETIPYLNEGQMPQLSYDLQAAVGEYGQIRRSWHRLRLLHYFCQSFGEQLCRTKTVLPREAADMEPADTEHLRYSVWVSGDSGFVFLNNFQDHFDLPDRKNESILLQLPEGDLQMEGIDLASGENAILPFNLDMDGAMLRYATAQPITKIEKTWFFSAPVGMVPAYYFDAAAVRLDCDTKDGLPCCLPEAGKTSHFTVHGKQGPLTVVTLNREEYIRLAGAQVKAQTKKIEDESARALLEDALDDVERLATKAVGYTEQTVAKALREAVKAGTGDREKLLALGRDVFNEVKREIGPETQEIIVKHLGSFDHYLEQCIENAVLKIKQADPYITLPGALVDGVGEAELKEGVGGAVAE